MKIRHMNLEIDFKPFYLHVGNDVPGRWDGDTFFVDADTFHPTLQVKCSFEDGDFWVGEDFTDPMEEVI